MKRLQTKRTNTVKIKNTMLKSFVVVCTAGLMITGCNKTEEPDKNDNSVIEDKKDEENGENIENNENVNNGENTNGEENGKNTENLPDDKINVEVTVPEKPITNPNYNKPSTKSQTPSKDSELSSYWTKLENCAKAGQNYYSEYYTKTRVITKDGYLYNYAASTLINVSYLANDGMLDSKYATSDVSLLLMYGRDVASHGGSNIHIVSSDKNEFTVFALMKHPTENKYIFTSANGSYGTITDTAYSSLMNHYSMNNGTVQRLTPSNNEYDRILSCIRMYESKYEQYFVRSITTDDKYAFVVLSGRANAATIREYILKYDNGIWEVVMDNLELESRLPVVVNKELPDFNVKLLPKYSLKDYKGSMLNDYTGVMDALTKAGLYAKDDTFYYFCGTTDYCYMITDSGKRFLCRKNGSTWDCYKVLDYYDALSRLQNMTNNPPTFILLDLE